MKRVQLLLRALCGVLLLAGCVVTTGCTTAQLSRELDARLSAGWRPSKGYCAWGGETERLAAYCARVNFGREGALAILYAVNRQALDGVTDGVMPWEQHIEQASNELEPYAQDYALAELEWCAANGSDCHRSLLVTDQVTGARFVLDNGRVIPGGVHVATYEQFVTLVAACGEPRCRSRR